MTVTPIQALHRSGVATRMIKTVLFLVFAFAQICWTAEPGEESQSFLSRSFTPTLMRAAQSAKANGEDPLALAKTAEQRRFLIEYFRVLDRHEVNDRMFYMEPLRRCGILFPEGTKVILIPHTGNLLVVHSAAGMKQIESYMGLTPDK